MKCMLLKSQKQHLGLLCISAHLLNKRWSMNTGMFPYMKNSLLMNKLKVQRYKRGQLLQHWNFTGISVQRVLMIFLYRYHMLKTIRKFLTGD